MRFDGKVAVVTGGGSGMGAATAKRLASDGAAVVIADVDADGGERAVTEITSAGGTALFRHADVSSDESMRGTVSFALSNWGRLDMFAHVAGIGQQATPFLETTDAGMWTRIADVNMYGTYYAIRAAAEHMIETGKGSIVGVASMSGLQAWPSLAAYAATKHAAVGIIRNAAQELMPLGVRINGVAPGYVNTPMLTGRPREVIDSLDAKQPRGTMGKPEEIAAVIAFLLSDDASFVSGQIVVADGGWSNGLS